MSCKSSRESQKRLFITQQCRRTFETCVIIIMVGMRTSDLTSLFPILHPKTEQNAFCFRDSFALKTQIQARSHREADDSTSSVNDFIAMSSTYVSSVIFKQCEIYRVLYQHRIKAILQSLVLTRYETLRVHRCCFPCCKSSK